MAKYEYKTVQFPVDRVWTGKPKEDYLQIINEYAQQGWRFIAFVPPICNARGFKGQELLFERTATESNV